MIHYYIYATLCILFASILWYLVSTHRKKTERIVQKYQRDLDQSYSDALLLSEIGAKLTKNLSVEHVGISLYKELNRLMDADVFGVGLFNKEQNAILFKGAHEKGIQLNDFSYGLQEDRVAVKCYLEGSVIEISDWNKEYHNYINKINVPKQGEMTRSLIYVPLSIDGEAIGVITVQSFKKNAYDLWHRSIMKNIAVYVSKAIENAILHESMEERNIEISRLSFVASKTDNYVTITDAEDKIEWVNSGFTRITGFESDEVIGRRPEDVLRGKGVNKATAREILEKRKNKQIINTEILNHTKSGDPIWLTIFATPILDEQGNLEKYITLGNDITEKKILTDRYQSLIDTMSEGIVMIDLNDEVKFANNRLCAMLGVRLDRLVGKDIKDLLWMRADDKADMLKKRARKTTKTMDKYELCLLDNNQQEVWVFVSETPTFDLEGKPSGSIAVVTNITRLKEVEKSLKHQNNEIKASINSAKRIQRGILTSKDYIDQLLSDSFILFKPKDIVSGDFYWADKKNDKVIIAVVDCTGHGVPAALLSIVGSNLINQAVNQKGITTPAKILDFMQENLKNAFSNDSYNKTEVTDGMDIALCSIDFKNMKLEFAGANNPLYIVQKSKLLQIEPDRIGISAEKDNLSKPFTNHELDLEEEDAIYLFTDGYVDQFGGPDNRKFSYKRLRSALVGFHKLEMEEQKERLKVIHREWKGTEQQIDDICMVGIRIRQRS